jgi:hypothetical protein
VPTNPEQINFTQETLGLRRAGFSPALSLLMPTESFPIAPTVLSVPLHSYGMLAYHHGDPQTSTIRNFGTWFKPRYIVGAGLLDQ